MKYLGIDVGSTTVKISVADPDTGEMLYSRYERHFSRQIQTVENLLKELADIYHDEVFISVLCGSGSKPLALQTGFYYIQEVVANASAVCSLYDNVQTVIEIGGQDAKVIFFYKDPNTGRLRVSDMRMNGNCAGGTGAFIDEIASLLNVSPAEFEKIASCGKSVYDISGRCGVFAKTDIQPLLIQGASKNDIALSVFHAIAKQIIGGLAQGLALKAPIIFDGGPFTFNPTLVRVFAEKLGLDDKDIIIPSHPETFVAYGAALAAGKLPESDGKVYGTAEYLAGKIKEYTEHIPADAETKPLFSDADQLKLFNKRHDGELMEDLDAKGPELDVYLGIDSGSTTSKFVLIDSEERVIYRFYSNNYGKPLDIIQKGLLEMYDEYTGKNIVLNIKGVGTTGYGGQMLATAFGADVHIVETVAHATASIHYKPNVSFLLDIGGQDMKAIWISDGIITDIMLNEACSSGCGSFLENFASSLKIPVEKISEYAFRSASPARLGSRCTVFMNSTIVTEQRKGKSPEDIMAGLCRSIIENVFTKVIRVANMEALGNEIVVQGGTFKNRAVLRAFEEYVGKDVVLAPYPGEMGALGAALTAKYNIENYGYAGKDRTAFIGFGGLKDFRYSSESGVQCGLCANHCTRTIMRFPSGRTWVTGNKCERGARITSKDFCKVRPARGINLFQERTALLFKEYACRQVSAGKSVTVGIPRVLEFWNSMPFWSTFFRSLGFNVVISDNSNQKIYESGLKYVASYTICFPAKLVHGHIENLVGKKVDVIFMPYIMHTPPEGKDKLSPYMCSIIMGYPMVVRNTQNPGAESGIRFDTPVFHWFSERDRRRQVCAYVSDKFGIDKKEAEAAYLQGLAAMTEFKETLREKSENIIKAARNSGQAVVVLAGRPYHSDSFISHSVSKYFTENGISVVPVDSLAGLEQVDLGNTRIEITNNFHTRMLAGAYLAAQSDILEYVQLVSFGCGHDAVLSDEIIRIMKECGGKSPLILKIDESSASGSLRIRVQSFIETFSLRRKLKPAYDRYPIPEPSPAKFYKEDKKIRTVLIPNISENVMILMKAIFEREGFNVQTVPIGQLPQIRLGKKYVHNDICFPCQMVIGELLSELQSGKYDTEKVAVGMIKFQCDCRMSHYAGLLRKGLDSAGFKNVPILTTDANDTKNNHPGVMLLGLKSIIEAVTAFMMLDIMTDIGRKIRPYEINSGDTDNCIRKCVEEISAALLGGGVKYAVKAFGHCIDEMSAIKYDRSITKPRVFVTGELLVTYHPGSNFNIEKYLERNGMETVFPRMTDQFRKDFLAQMWQIRDYKTETPKYPFLVSWIFDRVQQSLEKIAVKHPLYEKALKPAKLYDGVSDIMPNTLSCGEGWLMAAEIAHYAEQNVMFHIILQPFGCLPNHICGRGVIKKLKERFPDISILPLDLDPDTSYANVENRLQMLIMGNFNSTKE